MRNQGSYLFWWGVQIEPPKKRAKILHPCHAAPCSTFKASSSGSSWLRLRMASKAVSLSESLAWSSHVIPHGLQSIAKWRPWIFFMGWPTLTNQKDMINFALVPKNVDIRWYKMIEATILGYHYGIYLVEDLANLMWYRGLVPENRVKSLSQNGNLPTTLPQQGAFGSAPCMSKALITKKSLGMTGATWENPETFFVFFYYGVFYQAEPCRGSHHFQPHPITGYDQWLTVPSGCCGSVASFKQA